MPAAAPQATRVRRLFRGKPSHCPSWEAVPAPRCTQGLSRPTLCADSNAITPPQNCTTILRNGSAPLLLCRRSSTWDTLTRMVAGSTVLKTSPKPIAPRHGSRKRAGRVSDPKPSLSPMAINKGVSNSQRKPTMMRAARIPEITPRETSCGKASLWLRRSRKSSTLSVRCDLFRPKGFALCVIDCQLQILISASMSSSRSNS